MAKKGKKGKKKGKKDKNTGPQPFTTVHIIQERAKMLCPRMGDAFSRASDVEMMLEVYSTIIHKKNYQLIPSSMPFSPIIGCSY